MTKISEQFAIQQGARTDKEEQRRAKKDERKARKANKCIHACFKAGHTYLGRKHVLMIGCDSCRTCQNHPPMSTWPSCAELLLAVGKNMQTLRILPRSGSMMSQCEIVFLACLEPERLPASICFDDFLKSVWDGKTEYNSNSLRRRIPWQRLLVARLSIRGEQFLSTRLMLSRKPSRKEQTVRKLNLKYKKISTFFIFGHFLSESILGIVYLVSLLLNFQICVTDLLCVYRDIYIYTYEC